MWGQSPRAPSFSAASQDYSFDKRSVVTFYETLMESYELQLRTNEYQDLTLFDSIGQIWSSSKLPIQCIHKNLGSQEGMWPRISEETLNPAHLTLDFLPSSFLSHGTQQEYTGEKTMKITQSPKGKPTARQRYCRCLLYRKENKTSCILVQGPDDPFKYFQCLNFANETSCDVRMWDDPLTKRHTDKCHNGIS